MSIGPIGTEERLFGLLLLFPGIGVDPRHPIQNATTIPNILTKTVDNLIDRNRKQQRIVPTKHEPTVDPRGSLQRLLDCHRLKVMGWFNRRKVRKLVLATEGKRCCNLTDQSSNIRIVSDLCHGLEGVPGLKRGIALIGRGHIQNCTRLGSVDMEGGGFEEGRP
jgi:hypothetical protein